MSADVAHALGRGAMGLVDDRQEDPLADRRRHPAASGSRATMFAAAPRRPSAYS